VLPGPRELAPGSDTLELKLEATGANGVAEVAERDACDRSEARTSAVR
jgi:hypothetical protein